MQSMVQQIANTVGALNEMLAKLADLAGYEYQAGQAAEVMTGQVRGLEEAAYDAARAFDAMKQAADAAKQAAEAALAAMQAANISTNTSPRDD